MAETYEHVEKERDKLQVELDYQAVYNIELEQKNRKLRKLLEEAGVKNE